MENIESEGTGGGNHGGFREKKNRVWRKKNIIKDGRRGKNGGNRKMKAGGDRRLKTGGDKTRTKEGEKE